jgi:hypothetical protein
MGLAYLIQYGLAWVEFCTNYERSANSFLPHFIALNGAVWQCVVELNIVLELPLPTCNTHPRLILLYRTGVIQGVSAFFSFKVLPELDDAGYYSDKAVLSRSFVHENIYFSLFSIFGSIYYLHDQREALRTTTIGKIIEIVYVFFPYILIRPFFPVTSFSNAGTTRNGRSEQLERFYELATYSVKIFYLWAKYFLGFYINFNVYLNLVTDKHWKFLHGLFLLNVGTVSIAVFLHTLRFKKVLPPLLTFSLYLAQIYATFSAIPLAYDMFAGHPKICALCFVGMLCNMTRNRKIHGVWCCAALYALTQKTDIEW